MRPSKAAIKRIRLAVPVLVLVGVAAIALSGCAWTGKGRDVAQAMDKTAAFKSRAFSGSIDIKMGGAGANKPFSMTFTGASDNSDAANPKMTTTMNTAGTNVTVAMPGDGNMYMVLPTGTIGAPVPAADRSKTALDSAAIYAALGKAIGHFQDSQPMQNAQGKPVRTITARVSRTKICTKVLPAFGDLMAKASAGGATSGFPGLGSGGDGGGLAGFCKILLIGDPQVWFGIGDGGALTDVSLTANLAFPGAGPMTFDVQYHEYDQGQPQPSIKKPAAAKMYPSLQALGPAATPPGSATSPLSGAASQ